MRNGNIILFVQKGYPVDICGITINMDMMPVMKQNTELGTWKGEGSYEGAA